MLSRRGVRGLWVCRRQWSSSAEGRGRMAAHDSRVLGLPQQPWAAAGERDPRSLDVYGTLLEKHWEPDVEWMCEQLHCTRARLLSVFGDAEEWPASPFQSASPDCFLLLQLTAQPLQHVALHYRVMGRCPLPAAPAFGAAPGQRTESSRHRRGP